MNTIFLSIVGLEPVLPGWLKWVPIVTLATLIVFALLPNPTDKA